LDLLLPAVIAPKERERILLNETAAQKDKMIKLEDDINKGKKPDVKSNSQDVKWTF